MAFSPVATYAFVGTNYNKVASGDWTRYPVLSGQCINAAESTAQTIAKESSIFASAYANAASKLSNLAKSDKVFNGVSKTVKFVKNNINPLIVASGVTKVALAKKEDREKTIFSEGAMIGGMFAGEGWMKKNLDKVVLSKLPVSKKWMPVVKGTLFVAGSLTSSAIGQKLGQYAHKKLEQSREKAKSNSQLPFEALKIQNEKIKPYEPMELKA